MVEQVASVDLAFIFINLDELISCPGPHMGQVGSLILLSCLELASSFKGLAVWFYHLILSDETDWWLALDLLDFFIGL